MTTRIALVITILGAVGLGAITLAHAADGVYTLPFVNTVNAPGGQSGPSEGVMKIRVENGKSTVHLKVRNLYPKVVYTVWTVFGHLPLNPPGSAGFIIDGGPVPGGHAPVQCSPNNTSTSPLCPPGWSGWIGYHPEGHPVAPTAKISSRFTDGMGLDPGATFITDDNGDGHVMVRLDYDITSGAPLGNKNAITQTVLKVPSKICTPNAVDTSKVDCVDGVKDTKLNITTTYLRKFIGEFLLEDRAVMCANYDAPADPDVVGYDDNGVAKTEPHGVDARLWQCVDPATGMPRVPRFGFDHFRLANHVDDLTHGFIGGNSTDHIIDMVGLRACASPQLDALPAKQVVPTATNPTPAPVVSDYACPVVPGTAPSGQGRKGSSKSDK